MDSIESLKRENELLRELVKAKDALIKELNLKTAMPTFTTGLAQTITPTPLGPSVLPSYKIDYGPTCTTDAVFHDPISGKAFSSSEVIKKGIK